MTDSTSVFQQALTLHKAQQFETAKKKYLEALKINKKDAISHNNIGLIFFNEKNLKKAFFHFSKALQIDNKNITFLINLISTVELQNDYAKLEGLAESGLRISPNHPRIITSYLISLLKLNKLELAFKFISSVKHAPLTEILIHAIFISYSNKNPYDHPALKNSLGAIYQFFSTNSALSDEQKILSLKLNNNHCLIIDLTLRLIEIGFFSETLDQIFDLLFQVKCEDKESIRLSLIGIGKNRKGENKDALSFFIRAHDLDPKNTTILDELSQTYALIGDYEMAHHLCEKFNLQNMVRVHQLLSDKDFQAGWKLYLSAETHKLRLPHLPTFKRDNIHNKNILLYRDQGIGDEIMFLSVLQSLINDKPKSITYECSPRLESLINRSFDSQLNLISVDPKNSSDRKFAYLSEMPDLDEAIRTSELPLHYRNSLSDFSLNKSNYLKADPLLKNEWKNRLEQLNGRFKIGFAWKGGVNFRRGLQKNDLYVLKPLFSHADVSWVNLQYGDIEFEKEHFESEFHIKLHTWDDINYTTDLDQVAALMSELDLIIQINNTSLHLAGALGVNTWCPLLNDGSFDWRWFKGNVESDCPWYPSVKLFRQSKNEGLSDLFLRLSHALASWKEINA